VITSSSKKRTYGFTLIELMIVVLVVSILVGVAVPTYQNQVRKSRRTDAKTALLDMAGREAKFMTLNNAYTATPAQVGYSGSFPQTIGSGQYYTMSVCTSTAAGTSATTVACPGAAAGTTSFIIAAVPVAGTSQAKDGSCQYFAVDNTGAQYASSSSAGPPGTDTTSTCW
jgi:type IV pilus assembly protein PilE